MNSVPVAALPGDAMGGLTDIDGIFIRFFDAYAQYERDLADWNMKHGPKPAFAPLPQQTVTTPPASKTSGG